MPDSYLSDFSMWLLAQRESHRIEERYEDAAMIEDIHKTVEQFLQGRIRSHEPPRNSGDEPSPQQPESASDPGTTRKSPAS